MQAHWQKYKLQFKLPAKTSRNTLHEHLVWFLILENEQGKKGIGECAPIFGLSVELDERTVEEKISELCETINGKQTVKNDFFQEFPALQFAYETALLNLQAKENNILFPSEFTAGNIGIPINGLVWMGSFSFMKQQVRQLVEKDFRCVKLKIGGISFEDELRLLKFIRQEYQKENLELRLDANGSFRFEEALEKLNRLSDFNIHSMEQPIKAGQTEKMVKICAKSPILIALDEEIIGLKSKEEKEALLKQVKPAYIILKPTLIGGLLEADEWMKVAEGNNTAWWSTSALESNIGLNAIAQWVFTKKTRMPQGLGTGSLYTNNILSPLKPKAGQLYYQKDKDWHLSLFA